MMTELEAVAEATAIALNGAEGWAKAEATKAVEHIKKLHKAGQIDSDVFANAIERVSGNHSARRQRLASWGLVATPEADSAEKRAIQAAIERLAREEDAKAEKAIDLVMPKKP
jgi:hypothetical protein